MCGDDEHMKPKTHQKLVNRAPWSKYPVRNHPAPQNQWLAAPLTTRRLNTPPPRAEMGVVCSFGPLEQNPPPRQQSRRVLHPPCQIKPGGSLDDVEAFKKGFEPSNLGAASQKSFNPLPLTILPSDSSLLSRCDTPPLPLAGSLTSKTLLASIGGIPFALKRLPLPPPSPSGSSPPPLHSNPSLRAWATLSHPNVAPLVAAFVTPTALWLQSPHLSGTDLSALLRALHAARKRPPLAVVRRVVVDVLNALRALHAAHLPHRDVKLSNVVWQPSRTAALVDVSVAHVFDPPPPSATLQPGAPHAAPLLGSLTRGTLRRWGADGSLAYMPPEYFDEGCCANPFAADLWAVGMVALLLRATPREVDELGLHCGAVGVGGERTVRRITAKIMDSSADFGWFDGGGPLSKATRRMLSASPDDRTTASELLLGLSPSVL
jgi:serine/threonine protein kinase